MIFVLHEDKIKTSMITVYGTIYGNENIVQAWFKFHPGNILPKSYQ